LYPAPQKRKQNKPPDVEVVKASCYRSEGDVALDGSVRNPSEKAHAGVVLFFDFIAPGNLVIATKKIALDKEILEPGEEVEFHVRVADPVRAVEFRINAEDGQRRELRVTKNGPFPVE
jgi:hypothetical protein